MTEDTPSPPSNLLLFKRKREQAVLSADFSNVANRPKLSVGLAPAVYHRLVELKYIGELKNVADTVRNALLFCDFQRLMESKGLGTLKYLKNGKLAPDNWPESKLGFESPVLNWLRPIFTSRSKVSKILKFDFSQAAYDGLSVLKQYLKCESNIDLIRIALAEYEHCLVRTRIEGYEPCFEQNGKLTSAIENMQSYGLLL